MSGHIGDLSEAQQKALDSLRALVPVGEAHSTDQDLLRFLRARNFNVDAAHKQLSACQKWRKENDVDNILDGPYPLEEELRHTLSYCYYGEDKEGRPIYVERSGMVDAKTMMSLNADDVVRRHIYHQEKQIRRTEESAKRAGKPLDNWCEIHDMLGLSLQHRQVLGLFQKVARIDTDYYPERAGRIFFVNVPWVFPILWKICRRMLDPVTREKFVVLSVPQIGQLLDYIDADQLPVEYGGTVEGIVPRIDADRNGLLSSPNEEDMPSLTERRISTRSRFVRRLPCSGGGQVVAWYFHLDAHEVRFSVHWQEGESGDVVAVDEIDGSSKKISTVLKQTQPIQSSMKVVAAQGSINGSHVVKSAGTVWFVWENDAVFQSKILHYNVSVVDISDGPGPLPLELEQASPSKPATLTVNVEEASPTSEDFVHLEVHAGLSEQGPDALATVSAPSSPAHSEHLELA